MTKRLIGLMMYCLISCAAWGQTVQSVSEESLLNINAARQTDRSGGIYTGTPFVRIDSVSGNRPPATEWDKTKMRLFGTTDILKSDRPTRELTNTFSVPKLQPKTAEIRATVTPMFGKTWTTPLTSHTGDRSIMLQLTQTGDIIAKETIQTVQSEQGPPFTRTFPRRQGQDTPQILGLIQNKRSLPYTITETADALVIKGDIPLSAGEHRFELTYKLPRAVHAATPSETLEISLIGSDWPLATERFSGILLMPETVRVHTAQIGFGTNNLILPQGAIVNTDAKGNVFFKTTRLLPAFADVRLNVSLDGTFLKKNTFADWLDENPTWVAVLLWALLLTAYTAATLFTLRPKKKQNTTSFFSETAPVCFAALVNKTPDTAFFERLAVYEKCCGQKGRVTAFWRRMYAVNIGVPLMRLWLNIRLLGVHAAEISLLTLAFTVLVSYLKLSLSFAAWASICLIALITLMTLAPALKRQRRRRLAAAVALLSDENTVFGHGKEGFKKLFTRLYPYLLASGRLKIWTNRFQSHNLTKADFCFFSSDIKEDL